MIIDPEIRYRIGLLAPCHDIYLTEAQAVELRDVLLARWPVKQATSTAGPRMVDDAGAAFLLDEKP